MSSIVQLRQFYASAAMQGFMCSYEADMPYSDVNHADMATFAFKQADAMIQHEVNEQAEIQRTKDAIASMEVTDE